MCKKNKIGIERLAEARMYIDLQLRRKRHGENSLIIR